MFTMLLSGMLFLCANYLCAANNYYENSEGKIVFVYDEEQIRVDAYNATASTGIISNIYAKPSADEVAISTSCRLARDFKDIISNDKERIIDCIEKELQRLKAYEEVGDSAKISDSKGRIGILKKQYLK